MSRSPSEIVDGQSNEDYTGAFAAANRMVNEGMSWSGNERNRCFLNTGGVRFADVSATTGLDFLDDSRAIASVDWDGDGDLDLLQVNRTAPQVRFLRNQWDNDGHWLTLRLVGTQCNRDAVGARVELYRSNLATPDVRTVRAGNSFLSQSSKAIHFGLGKNTVITKVVVHWPGQGSETFRGLEANQTYRLVEGSNRVEQLPPRSGSLRIDNTPLPLAESTQQGRAVLSAPVPIPRLTIKRMDGTPAALTFAKRPTLVQLWASWCPMCQAEMHEFTQRADDVQKTGVRVVALSVDGLGDDTSNPSNARQAVSRMQYPFTVALGTEDLLQKLETLRGELFSNLTPFPVPTSFLLDNQGHLRVIYLGPMTVDQMLRDTAQLQATNQQWRDYASPMGGSWFTDPKPIRLINLAKVMADAGFASESQWYRDQAAPQIALGHCSLALDLERQGDRLGALAQYRQAIETDPQSARAYNLLGKFLMRQRQLDGALTALKNSALLDDADADTHFHLATLYVLRRELDKADQSYRDALTADPEHASAHAALGRLLQQQQRWPDAIDHLQSAIRLQPTLAPPYVYLGIIYAQQDKQQEAIRLFKQALNIQPTLTDARINLAELLVSRGDVNEGLKQYRLVLRSQPKATSVMGKLAWHLATNQAAEKKSPREAVEMAEQLASATQYRSAKALDILAASYADLGEYRKAADTIQKALALETSSQLKEELRRRLALYKDGRSLRIGDKP